MVGSRGGSDPKFPIDGVSGEGNLVIVWPSL